MSKYIESEVAIEIISSCLGIALKNKDKKMEKELIDKREKIYNGDMTEVKNVLEKYGKLIKKEIN